MDAVTRHEISDDREALPLTIEEIQLKQDYRHSIALECSVPLMFRVELVTGLSNTVICTIVHNRESISSVKDLWTVLDLNTSMPNQYLSY